MTMFLERALFVVAPQDSGKSTTLRSMFQDRRLGTNGQEPNSSEQRRLPASYHLSNDRRLHLRLTSPHEFGETPKEFIKKARENMPSGRWCFACPLQPDAHKKMPDVLRCLEIFSQAFRPERVRVVFLSPNRHGTVLNEYFPDAGKGPDMLSQIVAMPSTEVIAIDVRQRGRNGLLLSDFFDFT